MAFQFGDGFDLYATVNDVVAGYWDSGTLSFTLGAGRFAGSQAVLSPGAGVVWFAKSSGVNDAVHHIVCAFRQTIALSGTNAGMYFQLLDGVTGQCCVVFRSDGAILLTSGTTGGTTLATYTGAVTAQNTWFAFEFEVIISNTVGRFRARKNGNTVDDFDSGATLNTRPGANSYANKLQVGNALNIGAGAHLIDDFFWRSDVSSVAWLGDIRCYTRMPASDASVQFSRSTGATNASCVDEAQQNATTDYVFDSTINDADFYTIATIASTPVATIAVTTRGFMEKSDAGSRFAAVQLKSGSSTVASASTNLSSSWGWVWRTDLTDPATSTPWTAVGVNAVTIGPVITA